jgi:hypothetical protein
MLKPVELIEDDESLAEAMAQWRRRWPMPRG